LVLVHSLCKRSDFKAAALKGKKLFSPSFILQVLKDQPSAGVSVGITASRKVGNAVARNRAKRRLRVIIRLFAKDAPQEGIHCVLVARREVLTVPFQSLCEEAKKAFAWAYGI